MTLTDRATAKSDHSGQFLTADVSHLSSLVVARLSDKTLGPVLIVAMKN